MMINKECMKKTNCSLIFKETKEKFKEILIKESGASRKIANDKNGSVRVGSLIHIDKAAGGPERTGRLVNKNGHVTKVDAEKGRIYGSWGENLAVCVDRDEFSVIQY